MAQIFGPELFGRQRRPPKVAPPPPPLGALALQKVGPPKVEQSIRALARIWLEEVGGANLVGQGWWRKVGGGSGRTKGPAEPGSGREKAAPPPYTLCRPPPLCSKLVWRAPRALGSGQRWGAPLTPPSFPGGPPEGRREGCALKKKGPGRTRPRA